MKEDFSPFLSGKRLYGNDFSDKEIEKWVQDEKEGYADLGARDFKKYQYKYHKLNIYHGFKYIRGRKFENVLGLGSAYGDEFKPIVESIKYLTILEPSGAFNNQSEIFDTPCVFVKPHPMGHLPFEDDRFDLITSFGVMHHIPNVSYVMNECYRCLGPGGFMLIREPITSMGDFTRPRPGLTKRERGIPYEIFLEIISNSGFRIKNHSFCMFSPLSRILGKFGVSPYSSSINVAIDDWLSGLFKWNRKYYRKSILDKFSPGSLFFVLEK